MGQNYFDFVSGLSVRFIAWNCMRQMKKKSLSTQATPQKILLHVARKDGDWTGKATSFSTNEEYVFHNLKELFRWLNRHQVK